MTSLALAPSSIAIPSPADGLDSYISAVHRIPLLTEEEERRLGTVLKEHNDLAAARQLVSSHLRLVVSVARKYLGYGLPYADLIQEGNVGLMKAVKRFDVSRGVRLMSYAVHWINAEIQDYVVRNWRLVRIATTKAQRKLFFNLRSMKKTSHALTTEEAQDIARQLGVKASEVLEMDHRFAGTEMTIDSGDDENTYSPLEHMADPALPDPGEQLANHEVENIQRQDLQQALASLDERSRQIITQRWLADEDQRAVTLQDLSRQYGVSIERVRQIEVNAMKNLKARMQQNSA